jgi:hypothetical protein
MAPKTPRPLERLAEGFGGAEGGSLHVAPTQKTFGYTQEDLRILIGPMATDGKEPIGSMGDDTPLAVLSEKPQPLYNYFKQLFAR